MQGCPGSPIQAELGQAGAVPIPPSTPSSNGRQMNEAGGKGSEKGSGCGLPGAFAGLPGMFPGGLTGNGMPADAGCGSGAGNAQGFVFGNMPYPQNVPNLSSCGGNRTGSLNPNQSFCGGFQQSGCQNPSFQNIGCAGCVSGKFRKTKW